MTDASSTGWGAVCDGRPAFGTWSETEKSRHINCLELRAVHLALECFLPDILHRHVLIRTDSMTVVAFINHQGAVNSRPEVGRVPKNCTQVKVLLEIFTEVKVIV